MKAILLCLLIGGAGVGYVWQKSQIQELTTQTKNRERRLQELKRANDHAQKQLAIMQSPGYLELQNKQKGMGLVPPQPQQIWRLTEPARDLPPPEAQRQYASQGSPSAPAAPR